MAEADEVKDGVKMKLTLHGEAMLEVGNIDVMHTPSPGPTDVAVLDGDDMGMVHTPSLGPNDTHT